MTPQEPADETTTNDGPTTGSDGAPSEVTERGTVPITRRQVIAGGGLLAVLGAGIGTSHVLRPAEEIVPVVPEEDLEANGWVESDRTTETVIDDSVGPVTVRATAVTLQYENDGLRRDLLNTEVSIEFLGRTTTETLGDLVGSEFDRPMGVFTATKMDVTPHVDELPGGIGRARVMESVVIQANEQFERQLRDAGLVDVRQVETDTVEVDTAHSATYAEYRGTFVVEQTDVELEGTTIEIPGNAIEIAGHLAVWHDGRNVVLAAGTHPNETYSETVTETVQDEELTIEFDLDLAASSLREEVLGYMRRVR